MLDQNDTCYYDVQGALMYDPCIGAYDVQNDMYTLPFAEANNNVINYNASFMEHLATMDEECGFSDFRDQYMQFPPSGVQPPLMESKAKCEVWNEAYYAAWTVNPCFNVYMLGFTCPLLSDPLGYPTDLQLSYPGLPVYFNRTDVKKAIHAPMDVEWLECAPHPVFKGNGGPQGLGVSRAFCLHSFRCGTERCHYGSCADSSHRHVGPLCRSHPEGTTKSHRGDQQGVHVRTSPGTMHHSRILTRVQLQRGSRHGRSHQFNSPRHPEHGKLSISQYSRSSH